MREFSTDQRFTPGLCCKSSSVHQQIACTLPLYPQYVCVNGLPSDIPLLFIIYIDDITDLQLFDGSMTYVCWQYIAVPSHLYTCWLRPSIQQDSDDICTWTTNNLPNSTPPNASMVITVYIDNLRMEQVHSYRYLGVWLIYSELVVQVCQKAWLQINGIMFYGHSTLLQLYLACVRPHLELVIYR